MGDRSWVVEDVMDYFGEYFRSDKEAEQAMDECERRSDQGHKYSYSAKMNVMRDYLIERGHSVIFRTVYRRSK